MQLITLAEITEEDRRRGEEYRHARFLYNRYTTQEMSDWTKIDLYAALDLDGLRYSPISDKILKQAMKNKIWMYHPTRNRGRDEAYLLIMTAEKIFSSPAYRQLYDSVTLDESIPEDRPYTLEEFLGTFGPVFRRNGHFSAVQPVPELAGSVDEFYRFWNNFKTTRVYEDPEDVFEQRGCNRRYNLENKKEEIKERRDVDARRIRGLVKLAYQRDPRIKRVSTAAEAAWSEKELQSLKKFAMLMARSKNRYEDIAKKLNGLYLNRRTPLNVQYKLEEIGRQRTPLN